ncbi:PREDICTED: uncharacterized protein LOC104712570 [Camelina sativa]|uniref:Uncharacterized protein LOC104712570 n=1 Tax=Camelina sativa TaxID=90675 RepID=A0ABM0TKM9_CAMSA|nr:PREDICTED: uncharacterized protein LOC104712570 [Camelina sativa]
MGVETRSQVVEVRNHGVSAVDPLESRMSRLEDLVTEQNEQMKKHMAEQNQQMRTHMTEMFEALSRTTANRGKEVQREVEREESKFERGDNSQSYGRADPDSSSSKEVRSHQLDPPKVIRSDPVRTDAHYHYGNLTRLGKIDFPRFNGSQIKEWLFRVEEFFGVDYTPREMRVKMAAIHFDGHAATWHYSFVQSGIGLEVLYDWDGYVKLLRERFEDECDDPMAELKQLQETDGIIDYHQKFDLIKTRVTLS